MSLQYPNPTPVSAMCVAQAYVSLCRCKCYCWRLFCFLVLSVTGIFFKFVEDRTIVLSLCVQNTVLLLKQITDVDISSPVSSSDIDISSQAAHLARCGLNLWCLDSVLVRTW